ncbi:MAG TPA: hypothetical protein VEZ90_19215 [Blastocatellia bacterium]|nr:hypothetical protein [Blastocatellia bacterium]
MKLTSRLVRCLAFISLLAGPVLAGSRTGDASTATSYIVTIPDPGKHVFHVAMHINSSEPTIQVKMPTWMQAAYEIQSYYEQMQGVTGHDEAGKGVQVAAVDGHTWRISPPKVEPIVIEYDLDVSDKHKLFAKSYLEKQVGMISGGTFFLYDPTERRKPTLVKVILPKGWAAAAALDNADSGSSPDAACFKAKDYDELTDSPIMLGSFKRTDFSVEGIPFSVVTDERISHDQNSFVESARQIAQREIDFFGSAPFDRYIFMYYSTKDPSGGGERTPLVGVEHLKSTLITIDPEFDAIPIAKSICRSASAHELFHAWNVKATRPVSLNYPDFDTAPAVQSLWLLEGFTEYYAQKFMFQLYGGDKYASFYQGIGQYLTDSQYSLSLARLSLRAPWESLRDFGILYSKGSIAGLLLDLKLRQLTNNQRGLDDFMRQLWVKYGRNRKPYNEQDLLPILNEVAKSDLSEFYQHFIIGLDPLPLSDYLAIGGLTINGQEQKSPFMGWEFNYRTWTVVDLDHTGNAAKAGAQIGDKLVKIDKSDVNQQSLNKMTNAFARGETPICTIERNGTQTDIKIKQVETMLIKPTINESPHATPEQIAIRKAVLSATSASDSAKASAANGSNH